MKVFTLLSLFTILNLLAPLQASEDFYWDLKLSSFGRSAKTMLKTKEQISIEEMEQAISELETKLGPIIFEDHPLFYQTDIELRNRERLKTLTQAVAPFHRISLQNAKELAAAIEKKSSVDPTAFRNLDRALFGYLAIFRKLLALENAYGLLDFPSPAITSQILAAKSLATLLCADLFEALFLTSKTRAMFQDLLSEERPLARSYQERNKELHAHFIRALDSETREKLNSDLQQPHLNLAPIMTPFSLDRAKKIISSRRSHLAMSFSDELQSSMQAATYELSKIFGKVAGNVKFRRGHFWLRKDVTRFMATNLRPFDLILDKAPFALSDRFIPGHYTHAAIYLGTKEQLQEIGMWNHPALAPYRRDIEGGKVIVEALRPGTKMSYLHEFQNVDEIAAYRIKGILDNPIRLEVSLETLMAQIGKDYDFNFDVSTTSSIVCSELVYHSMAQIHWPTEYKVGRETISPDNLAELAFYENAPLSLVFNIYAEEKNQLKQRSPEEVGALLGFERTGENTYEKVGQYCYNEVQSHIRVGSRRTRHLEMRKCSKTTTPLVYN